MSIKRETLADTFALITFSFVIGMSVEIFIAGLSLEQSLQSRLMSIPVNMIIARPYGLYRDWMFRFAHVFKVKGLGEMIMDIVSFLSFQMPVYAGLVFATGATTDQVITASLGQVGALIFMARPYGMYMQACRNWFMAPKLQPA